MRILAAISIQPHVKKKLTPRALLPLPWDRGKNRKPGISQQTPPLSKEEQRRRFYDLRDRLADR